MAGWPGRLASSAEVRRNPQPRRVGCRADYARWSKIAGDAFTAAHALEIGLVNAVVPHDELLPAAHALAQRIIRHSPLAVTSVITAVTRGINLSIGEGLEVEREQFARMAPTRDLADALNAWTARGASPAAAGPGRTT